MALHRCKQAFSCHKNSCETLTELVMTDTNGYARHAQAANLLATCIMFNAQATPRATKRAAIHAIASWLHGICACTPYLTVTTTTLIASAPRESLLPCVNALIALINAQQAHGCSGVAALHHAALMRPLLSALINHSNGQILRIPQRKKRELMNACITYLSCTMCQHERNACTQYVHDVTDRTDPLDLTCAHAMCKTRYATAALLVNIGEVEDSQLTLSVYTEQSRAIKNILIPMCRRRFILTRRARPPSSRLMWWACPDADMACACLIQALGHAYATESTAKQDHPFQTLGIKVKQLLVRHLFDFGVTLHLGSEYHDDEAHSNILQALFALVAIWDAEPEDSTLDARTRLKRFIAPTYTSSKPCVDTSDGDHPITDDTQDSAPAA